MKMKNYLWLILICMSFVASAQTTNGYASFIGDEFHKLKMASGETYDKTTMVAQHRDLPYGTKVKVTNNNNGETVIVTIKDRGPFIKGEIIGLSHAAGKALGMTYGKKAPVRIEVVGAGNTVIATDETAKTRSTVSKNTTKERIEVKEYSKQTTKSTPKKEVISTTKGATTKPAPKKKSAPKKTWSSSTGIYKADIMNQPKKGYGVQIGVFSDMNVVIKRIMALKAKGFKDVYFTVDTKNGKTSHKIIIGNYDSQAKASSYKKNLKSKFKLDGFVVNFAEL